MSSVEVVAKLERLLADVIALSLKTRYLHWNVTGAEFYSIHALAEKQYDELDTAADDIAERIRGLGSVVKASWAGIASMKCIEDMSAGPHPQASDMIRQLVADHEKVLQHLNEIVTFANDNGDGVTADIASQQRQAQAKMHWMLNSTIGRSEAPAGK